MDYKLLAFTTTFESLKAEDLLIRNGILVNPIPIPRNIRVDCSLGLLIKFLDIQKGENILRNEGISFSIYDHQNL